ncbi:MAG: aminotransferase class I/II-fold pyridoxal phosphate-dependent enzyme [Synergistaceae bacterium]|nr:aminotransferase class I/II-fold pyridoxal phosphate-dependent enzyme [Synergistaceae bacterium]
MPERVVDFSTNANVLPWRGWETLTALSLPQLLSAYPDDEAEELRAIVAGLESCPIENVLAVNGSNEAVFLLASFFAGKKAAVLQPAYGEYLRALLAHGADVSGVTTLEHLPEDAEAFFLCNPCNPTGAYIEGGTLEGLFARRPYTLFVVDEAYINFLTGERWKIDFLRYDNVVLLRSLTKIFHLCGARVGYVLAGGKWVGRLKSRQPTWSVNALAQAAAAAFLRDEDFVRETRAFYAAETPRFIAEVERAGFTVVPTRTNFFLINVSRLGDGEVIRALLERGLSVRHTRNFPGLGGRYIRVATRLPGENDLLVRALLQGFSPGNFA